GVPDGAGGPAHRRRAAAAADAGAAEVPGAEPGLLDRAGPPRAGLRPAAPLRRRPGGNAALVQAGPRGAARAGRQRAAAPGAAQVWLNRPPCVDQGQDGGAFFMSGPVAEHLLTAQEYLQLPDRGVPTELVRGKVVEMNVPTPRHGQICGKVARIVGHYPHQPALRPAPTNA